MKKALLIIDVQYDYFEGGKFPLWNTQPVLDKIEEAIAKAQENGVPVVFIQHVADTSAGPAPFFTPGSKGVHIHANLLALAPEAPVVTKAYADSFYKTGLQQCLLELQVDELLLCGMMTQNCVTHTALSKTAENYAITVLTDCCTTVSEPIHLFALNALSTRVTLETFEKALEK